MSVLLDYIITTALSGGYLLPWKSTTGRKCLRLYTKEGKPIANIQPRSFKSISKHIDPRNDIWREDEKTGRIIIVRRNIQKLHGRTRIKKLYKKHLHEKNHH